MFVREHVVYIDVAVRKALLSIRILYVKVVWEYVYVQL